jgi:hypothetical protein
MAPPLLTQLLAPIPAFSWLIHIKILLCSEVTLEIFAWKQLHWATVSICVRLVQVEPIQWLFCAMAYRPLKIVTMSTGTGIPLRHQLMDLLSKQPLEGLFLRSPNCFHLNNPHRVPVSIRCLHIPLTHGLMQILSADRLGVISCFRIFLLTELNAPPRTGNMK